LTQVQKGLVLGAPLNRNGIVAHVVSEFARGDLLLAGLFEPLSGLVAGSLLAVVLARLADSGASLL